ncbi:facilitated trehalose transporter Tret1-like isoform X2 [Palaemon carinicauda]|uniref:facilitated trehalose transporter Tret1-like isoform X2 n=1 Tax=Palaemon carinicauda TaxID=392227 RepID=UPI0035B5EB75
MAYQNDAINDSYTSNNLKEDSLNVYLVEEDVFYREKEVHELTRVEKFQENPQEKKWRLLRQAVIVFLSSLGMWSCGSVITYSAVVAYDLETHNTTIYGDPIEFSSKEFDQLSSLKTIAAIPGAFAIALLMEPLGRRLCMAISGLLMVVGWFGIAFVHGVEGMLISRVISGVAVGGLSISINTYIVEIVDREIIGKMSVIASSAILGGELVSLTLGYAFRYYTAGLLLLIFPVAFLLSLFWLPEVPSVLILKEDARKILVKLRGKYADIDAEVQSCKDMNKVTEDNRSPWKELRARKTILALVRVCILFILMHLTGYYVVTANCTRIFMVAGSSIDDSIASVMVTSVQLVGALFAGFLIDTLGRRKSLIISYGIMSVPLAVMAAYFGVCGEDILDGEMQKETNPYGWIPVVCLMTSQAAVVLGVNPVPFLLSNEYFPTFIRPQASGICFVVSTLVGSIVLQLYTPMVEGMTEAGVFTFYACSCVVGIPFTFFFIKETKGKRVG